jgi:TolB protein
VDEPVAFAQPIEPVRAPRGRRIAALVIGAVAIIVVAALVVSRAAAPTRPAARLVMVGPDGGLAIADATGGAVRPLNVPITDVMFPAWSPDGRRIAAIGSDESGFGVFVVEPGAGGSAADSSIAVYSHPDQQPIYLAWTPDSRSVAFLTGEPSTISLRVAPADAGAPATIVHQAQPFYWDFVDAGRMMIHTGSVGSGAFIGEIDLAGQLDEASSDAGLFRTPAVVAGGRYRAFVRTVGDLIAEGQEVVVEARDGSSRHATPVHGNVAIGFDPQGSSLAFIGATGPAAPSPVPLGPLRVLDVETGAVRTVVDARVIGFFWSPDGRTIATIEIVSADGGDPNEALGPGRGVAVLGEPIPDLAAVQAPGVGIHLRFVEMDSGRTLSERDVRVSELFAFQLLPYFDQYARSHLLWSVDSRSIVLPIARDTGVTGIVSLPADGSEPRPIADGRLAFWSP